MWRLNDYICQHSPLKWSEQCFTFTYLCEAYILLYYNDIDKMVESMHQKHILKYRYIL